ncbi:hypothetical protein LIER_22264 [Lithospermum erythrorhizon]|uniref:SPX domain-containing protein n=1 Tax=Lithospermum erythrorhizon TaxID=34254 RepID=A0AAV3QWN8_LITER
MKFRKHLSASIERILPGWQDKFLSYKKLKKQLQKIYPKDDLEERARKRTRLEDGHEEQVEEQEVNCFMELLDKEIHKFNEFFLDKEEDYVIKMEVLQERVGEVKGSLLESLEVVRQITEFHGEMVLLENYSALNYTGLVKILKKYDRRSGALVRKPFIQKILQQPFYKTDGLNNLVKQCEQMVEHLLSSNPLEAPSPQTNNVPDNEGAGGSEEGLQKVPEELEEIMNMENTYLRLTLSALRLLNDIRSRSPTVSELSLPLVQTEDVQDILGDPPIIEQAAE